MCGVVEQHCYCYCCCWVFGDVLLTTLLVLLFNCSSYSLATPASYPFTPSHSLCCSPYIQPHFPAIVVTRRLCYSPFPVHGFGCSVMTQLFWFQRSQFTGSTTHTFTVTFGFTFTTGYYVCGSLHTTTHWLGSHSHVVVQEKRCSSVGACVDST